MSGQVKLNHSADDVAQMRRDWAESSHFDAPADLPGLLDDYDALHAEAEALRGLTPELPPRPPEGAGLPRYGLRWNGPAQPLSVPIDDGYWTPWHLAEALRAENAKLRAALAEQGERQEAVAWYTEDHLTDKSATTWNNDVAERWRAKGWPVGNLYTTPQPGPDVRALVEALEECAASLAWNCLGECRAIHAGPIMPAAMALDKARTALAAHRQAQS